MLEKTFRGLVTVNLRAFRFASDPSQLRDYLRGLEHAYESCSYPPMKVVELAEIVGKEACQPAKIPLALYL